MNQPKIFRKRFIPEEIVDISSDELLFRNQNVLITQWKTIKPRRDFAWGISFTFLNDGYKISRFYDSDKNFLFWYCDIIEVEYSEKNDTYTMIDLLVDIKIMPNGKVKVLDIEELSDALEKKIITQNQGVKALKNLSRLMEMINNDKFPPSICKEERFLVEEKKQQGPRIEIIDSSNTKKIRVMTVDDSVFFNRVLSDCLGEDSEIEVVSSVFDAFEADKKLNDCKVDVMTLDVIMPGLNGIEFLKNLMIERPMPVIVVSSVGSYIFDALKAGAVEFIAKPQSMQKHVIKTFAQEIIAKIKIAANARVDIKKKEKIQIRDNKIDHIKDMVIAIGCSTGGTEATYKILTSLPQDMPPIVIAQHMPQSFTGMYAERLNKFSALDVKEAADGDFLLPGRVLIAPGDFHMRIKNSGGTMSVTCSKDEKVNGHRPSVDVLFNSVAEVAGKNAVGIILTGMGSDGAKGLYKMKANGAFTIGQNEATCVVYGMPKVAFDMGAVQKQVSIEKVVETLLDILKK